MAGNINQRVGCLDVARGFPNHGDQFEHMVWRICFSGNQSLSALPDGATLGPGRWHVPPPLGLPIIYTASSRSLAHLEKRVHANGVAPVRQTLIRLELPMGAVVLDAKNDLALQELGEELVSVDKDKLAQLGLSERLHEAIMEARSISKFGALRRQMQYIGRLMREEGDAQTIRERLDVWNGHAPHDPPRSPGGLQL